MEIERKYLVKTVPFSLDKYEKKDMQQLYISTKPVIRIRKSNEKRIMTIKSGGLLSREEYEMEITQEEFDNLKTKAEGNLIEKTRYLIPYKEISAEEGDKKVVESPTATSSMGSDLFIELDIFHGDFEGLIYAEVEFDSVDRANKFVPPHWFFKDVTESGAYQNSVLSRMKKEDIEDFIKNAYVR